MGRPAGYQWQPLGWTEDPVPGDPAEISQEAQHLASVAAQIADQVSALRRIASDGTEVGEHADTIRSNAGSVATELDKLVGRYQQVSSILNSWVPDLEQAQAMSIQALDQAEGPYKQLNQTVALPSGDNLTPAEQQGIDRYHQAMRQAQGQLDDARALLNRAIALRDSSGASHANQINNACNDGMRDHHSFWGSVAGFFTAQFSWVTKNWSQIVADICTVLEVLATIAAVLAFVLAQFVPGLDALADALVLSAFLATVPALAGRTLLAATGHGSWLDVAMDAFAVASFGIGGVAGDVGEDLLPQAEKASQLAFKSRLLTDFATDGKLSGYITRFADLQGISPIDAIEQLSERAPSLVDSPELTGFPKFMMSVGGGLSSESSNYAKLMAYAAKFPELSQYGTAAKLLANVTGVSGGAALLTGVGSLAANGIELDAGSWSGSFEFSPTLHNWYTRDLEVPTGAPAGG
ncbi:MAG TPA: hypothetical protein VMU95_33415 [Trebonia sp.]|nr:hypothetical protein [Trebonia sp.]